MEASLAKEKKSLAVAVLRVGVLPVTCHSPPPLFRGDIGTMFRGNTGDTFSLYPPLRLSAACAKLKGAKPGVGDGECLPHRRGQGRSFRICGLGPCDGPKYRQHQPGRTPWAARATGTTTPSHPHRPSEGCARRGSAAPEQGSRPLPPAPRARPFAAGRARRGRGGLEGERGRRRGTVWPDTCVVPSRAEWASAARLGWGPLPLYHLISASV